MIYSLSGIVAKKAGQILVLDVHGVGFKIFASEKDMENWNIGEEAHIFCHLHVREDSLDIFGFSSEAKLKFFELLISISGVGPKSALAILDTASLEELTSAIQEGRPDLLTRAAGIGRKTAERVVIELKGRVAALQSEKTVEKMEGDQDLVEVLVGLGYKRSDARDTVGKIKSQGPLEDRLKGALQLLNKK